MTRDRTVGRAEKRVESREAGEKVPCTYRQLPPKHVPKAQQQRGAFIDFLKQSFSLAVFPLPGSPKSAEIPSF
ncbi:unnamed protein product [Victoria cruziana]